MNHHDSSLIIDHQRLKISQLSYQIKTELYHDTSKLKLTVTTNVPISFWIDIFNEWMIFWHKLSLITFKLKKTYLSLRYHII